MALRTRCCYKVVAAGVLASKEEVALAEMVVTNRKLRVGIVGCGRVVEEAHVPALRSVRDQIECVAVVDVRSGRRNLIGDLMGVDSQHRHEDIAMLPPSSTDLILVAVPNVAHQALVHRLLETGNTILLEKPPILDAATVLRGRQSIYVCHNYLFRPDVTLALQLVKDGAIGSVRYLRFVEFVGSPWTGADECEPIWRRNSKTAGCVRDKGYHFVYLAEALGGPITRFSGYVAGELHDYGVVLCSHIGGATTVIEVGWDRQIEESIWEITGSTGSLRIEHGMVTISRGDAERQFEAPGDLWGYTEMYRTIANRSNLLASISVKCAARVTSVLESICSSRELQVFELREDAET